MKDFIFRLNSFIHKIGVLINTPRPARPRHISPHCTNINMLLMHLCDFDADRYSYILQWLAYPLRNPGAKMSYGLIINGAAGTGINMFFQLVAVALHQGKGRIIHADVLSNRFNSWAGAPLIVIDGHVTERTLAQAKQLMSSKSLIVESKGQPPREMPNQMNFVFLSGDINPLKVAGAERRFMVLEAPPPRERAFYQAIATEIADGGGDAFRQYLLHGIDMAGFNETTLPPEFVRADPSELRGKSLHLVKESA